MVLRAVRSPLSHIPLKLLLVLPFVIQVTAAVGVTGWLSLRNGQRAVNDVASQLREEVANRIEQKLAEFLAAPPTVNRLNLEAIQLGYVDINDPDGLYSHFYRQGQEFRAVEAIFFGHANGEFVGSVHFTANRYQQMRAGPSQGGSIRFYDMDQTGAPTALVQETGGWNTQTRPWYRAAAMAGRPVWADIFTYHAFPVMALPAVAPVYGEDGTLLGVLGDNFFLSQVSDFLATLTIGDTGQTFIMERDGLLVASSALRQPFKVIDHQPQRIYTVTSQEPLMRSAAQFLLRQYDSDFNRIQSPIQHVYRLQGQQQFLLVRPFQDDMGLDWLIVVVVPESNFMAQIHANTRQTVVLCGLALMVAIASGLFTTRWITRPLWQLSLASQAIAQGDLQQTIPPTGLRELEVLARAFNRMAIRLERSFAALQQSKVDLENANEELQAQATRFRLIAENMSDLVCLHDPEGKYLYVSPSVEWLLGYGQEELIGQNPYDLFHPLDRKLIRKASHERVLQGLPATITYRMRKRSGEYIWLETITRPIFDDQGQILQLQTASREVTEQIHMRQQLEYEASHDALTGLPNRNLLAERLELALERVSEQQFALLFLDLDRFKVVNDSLGHLIGDQVLLEVSRRLTAVIRTTDFVARLGGDEFIVLIEPVISLEDALHVVKRIFKSLQRPLAVDSQELFINVSIGVVLGNASYTQAAEVIRDADIAMYRAKARGRASYEIFNPAMHLQAFERLRLENDMHRAIAEHPEEFVLFYQPILSLGDHRLKGFEALVRWQHPELGLVSPTEFIPLAEETGLITPLSYWLLGEACRHLHDWQQQLPMADVTVSVNLSLAQLRDPNFLQRIQLTLDKTGLSGQNLILELTESMLVDNVDDTILLLTQLVHQGIAISIDDFGTGYSSLNYLAQFPVHTLKVDKSFVSQMLTNQNQRRIVATIITLAHQLGFQTIAEGIETQEQAGMLKMLQCDFGQGYWLGQPQDQKVTQDWLQQYFRRP